MDFVTKVLEIVKKVPKGKVTTYKSIAKALNTSPRAVGQALKNNPKLVKIPCHRVVKSDWSLGGYVKGQKEKKKLLKKEGVNVKNLRNHFIPINNKITHATNNIKTRY
jgi:methylated-DNA-[protein]-cysteine S-methyltransferase